MNKKISVSLALTIAIIAMTVTFSVTMILARQIFDQTIPSVQEKESMYSKLSELDKYVRANYYGDIQDPTLFDMISYGYILGTGDRNATYYTAKQYTELLEVQSGNIVGVGVDVVKDTSGYARITQVYAGSPAEELGLQVGGFITAIDGADVKNLTRENVLARLQGESGTEVVISYMSPDNETADYTVIRSKYVIPSVEYQMMEDAVGYIRIIQFDSTTLNQFSQAVNDLTGQGAVALMFDLRGNGGGVLSAAVDCIDLLVPKGDIVYAEDKNGERTLMGESDESSVDLPMVVLVDGTTASSAELFAASLREFSGAQLVGQTTYGKGTIQAEPHRMSDGSAVVVTVAKMITGAGSTFDGTGLTVDIEVAPGASADASTPIESDTQAIRALAAAKLAAGVTSSGGDADATSGESADSTSGAEDTSGAEPASDSTDAE
ncbi:MAG TPA: PDZ domain-containing protein [Candidatus Fournierella merdigallinarum]|nr:PDZ domain-containing protein [Candidatus Fournierella merdigallinarum]